MTLVCVVCATENMRWEPRCTSCWNPLPEPAAAPEQTPPHSPDPPPREKRPLGEQLEIEAAHVEALAAEGIHTLAHVAEALPDKLAHALWPWPHIDVDALIARAQQLLHGDGVRNT